MAPERVRIRVLGELEITRGEAVVPLPTSKKTRALLGYLVVARGRPQPRQRLCELFWDGPDDPRAALRWSLTKIRPLVDGPGEKRLVADREHVAFEPRGASVDLVSALEAAAAAHAPLDALRAAADLYRGELLEGLDLPDCYRYHEWCVAQREAARKARATLLTTLVERLADDPAAALPYARAHVAIDPLAESAHVAVMRLLGALGRPREALQQYERCRRMLEAQLGRSPSRELEVARAAVGQTTASAAPPAKAIRAAPPAPPRTALIGRAAERETIAAALRDATGGALRTVLLISGEPGIGKTRLLEEAADQARALGGAALAGRAFEAEMVRPYGPWIDALRAVVQAGADAIDPSVRADLAPLLPELGGRRDGVADQSSLFSAVAGLLANRAAPAAGGAAGPLVVALDDLQWFDEASTALLHYLARSVPGSRILIACAVRSAEVDANPPVRALLRALDREGRLVRVEPPPLDRAAVEELLRALDDRVDAGRIFVEGGGNPLYTLELGRAAAQGDGATSSQTLAAVIAERLSRLDDRAAELLPWAASIGRAFAVHTLAALTSLSATDLLGALEDLERHGVLRAVGVAPGDAGYDFAHDLVRQAAYRTMSEPRRRWVHLHIARTLHAARDDEGVLAAEVAHHAALGGDSELAARAYVVAGERCLRLFAYADANRLAGSGLQHADRLPPEAAIRSRLALLAIQVHSNQWLRRPQELEGELARVAQLAGPRGMSREAARAYYLMSFVHHERGDLPRARDRSLEAERVSRAADAETRQLQLANSGRCLVLIERDIPRARELLREAESLGSQVGGRAGLELVLGKGHLCAFEGADDEALPLLERGAELAEALSDHWACAHALIGAARLALERGRPGEALERCRALEPLVAKLSEGSEGPFVRALQAVSRLELGEAGALSEAEAALEALRLVDSKALVAYVLNALADHDARRGRSDEARLRARDALAAADAVGHRSEAAVARSRLALLALDRGDRAEAAAVLDACPPEWSTPGAVSARARAALAAAAERLGAPA